MFLVYNFVNITYARLKPFFKGYYLQSKYLLLGSFVILIKYMNVNIQDT